MKDIIQKYGWIATAILVISIAISLAAPTANYIRDNLVGIVDGLGEYINNSFVDSDENFDSDDKHEEKPIAPGLYQTGSDYTVLLKSWDELTNKNIIRLEDGVVYTNFDFGKWTNLSSDMLIGDLVLPNDGSITALGESAFDSCYGLTSINIPDGVTSIGACAFYGCADLTNVRIPDSVISIEESVFYQCSSLTSIKIPSKTTIIGYWVFCGCTNLTNIEFHDNIKYINNGAFYGCTGLTSLVIPLGVENIEENAFYGCTGLTNIKILNSVAIIDDWAFYGCNGLTSITIYATTPPTLGPNTFINCSKLNTIYVPAGSIEAYKTASGWSNYAAKIQSIPTT